MKEDEQKSSQSEDKPLSPSGNQSDGTPLNESQNPSYHSTDSDPNEDETDLFEITIHSLTGTIFQVRVSPWETGDGLKNLLQRSQGIPAHHQHLLHGNKELLYEESLIDQGIVDGSTLKLVLSLRGGPINSRRMSIPDDSVWKEFSDFVDMNREELYDCSEEDNHVTLLVLQEGEEVNLYRVVENEDGSLSPLNDSWKSTSSRGPDVPDEDEIFNSENAFLHDKLLDLKVKMAALRINRKERKQKPMPKQLTPRQKIFPNKQPERSVHLQGHPQSFKLKSLNEDIKLEERKKSIGGRKSQRVPYIYEDTKYREHIRSSTGRKLANAKPHLSRGKMLDELPGQLVPKHVEFSRHPKLESIKASRVRHYLGPLQEDSMSSSLSYHNRGIHSKKRIHVWNGTNYLGDMTTENEQIRPESREAIHRSDAPVPFYLNDSTAKQNKETERLTKTQNENSLTNFEDFYDRPKTSPEVLQHRPISASTTSSFNERIRLKTTDDKLKEIIGILNSSRTSSPITHRSTKSFNSSDTKGQKSLINSKNSWQSLRGSFSLSITSFRELQSPMAPSTSVMKSNVRLEHTDSIRKEFATSVNHNLSSRKMSNTDLKFKRPRSNRSKLSTPRLPRVPRTRVKLPQKRCAECSRKLKVSYIFTCRCGLLFCAQHRYAETHNCSYDYKAHGKKFIELTNPLVMPPKLPKI